MANKQNNLRATRIAAVQAALQARRVAAKQAKHAAAVIAHEQSVAKAEQVAAYKQQLAALRQQYGIAKVASNGDIKVPKQGTTCHTVWELAKQNAYNRAATLAACAAANINKATAQTQYALANRAQGTY